MKILYLPNEYSQQRQREKRRWIYPVFLAMEATYMRNMGHEVIWDDPSQWKECDCVVTDVEGHSFLSLPPPDRKLTKAFDSKYQNNGNFKYRPGTYIQAANGCWHGKCSFCVEQKNKWEVRSVNDVIQEIEECASLGFKEVFDDSGTFPTGAWLEEFCYKVRWTFMPFSCNMRMVDVDYNMLKHAGFRMLLFGLESANQKTLDRISKGTQVEDVRYIMEAARAGLEPHVAVMFGFPWETDEDALMTLRMVWWLLRKGYAKTAQASFYTPLNGGHNKEQKKYVKQIYKVARYPEFWFNKIRDIHDKDDLKYLWRQIKEGIKNA